MTFELHPNLAKRQFVIDLPLCRVILEDDTNYPWLNLIPRRPNVFRIMDLEPKDQLQLLKELDMAQKILWELFSPTQLNVAAIGNKIPQLHVHVIARKEGDPAWPGTVWDHPVRNKHTPESLEKLTQLLHHRFASFPSSM